MVIRNFSTQDTAVPTGDLIWKIIISTEFNAAKDPSYFHIALLKESPFIKIMSQAISHPNISIEHIVQNYTNEIRAIADKTGKQELNIEFVIHAGNQKRWFSKHQPRKGLTVQQRELYLRDINGMNLFDTAFSEVLSTLRERVTDLAALEQEIYRYVYKHIVLDPKLAYQDVPTTLKLRRGNALAKTMAFVALARASKIPARLVTGIELQEAIDSELLYWAELYSDGQWQPYDLEHGYTLELPPNYIAFAFDRDTVSYFEDPTPIETTIDVELMPSSSGTFGDNIQFLRVIDLTRLAVATQQLLAILLILPLCALITQIFRQIVGVKTFGTFSASLLALSIYYADWITVAVILTTVGIIGLGGRSLIAEGFTRIPRLVIIFTLVAMSMAFAISLMDYLNMNPAANAVLLPIVILVTLVDRIYATQEERGMTVTVYRAAWTAVVAFFCFLLFQIDWLKQLVLVNPEIHFFTLALVLIISSYSSTTIIDKPAFQLLREPTKEKSNSAKSKEKEPSETE
ncbi:MAG: transglutaminase-like domain-containing protein [Gammaproteobacteria bacterium]|nr:transglutaminase-like domain-containing protein [Gammaproteobacteria bacterium]